MFEEPELSAGANRLRNGRLKPNDVRLLKSVFLIYLKDRAADFSDLTERLNAVVNDGEDEPASELAALALLFKENGFSLADLKGGKSTLQTDKKGEFVFKIRYGLTMLDYELPETFSGEMESGSNGDGNSGTFLFGTISMKKDLSGW